MISRSESATQIGEPVLPSAGSHSNIEGGGYTMEGIFCKFDWISFIISDSSLREVASRFLLDGAFPSFIEHSYATTIGSMSYLSYDWNGVKFFISASDLAGIPQDVQASEHFFDLKFSKIKIDFPGQALDFVRDNFHEGQGREPFDWFCYQLYKKDQERTVRLTRCDFANDFVNYKASLFKDMNDFVRSQDAAGVTRLHCKGLPSGCSYSFRGGDQGTIYIGTTACDKLLRIYDKKRQFFDPALQMWKKPEKELPFGFCESWNRMEFQTRRKAARTIFLEDYDSLGQLYASVLRLVYDRYAFRDGAVDRRKQPDIMPFWQQLTPDWEDIGKVIQKYQFVESVKILDKATSFVKGTAFRSIFVLLSVYGVDGFVQMMEDLLEDIQSGHEFDTPIAFVKQVRTAKLRTTLACLGSSLADFPGLRSDNGILKFNSDLIERKVKLNA